MIGYKATDMDGCCRGFKFEVGKTYTKNTPKEELECCTDKVFHFCRELFAIENEVVINTYDSTLDIVSVITHYEDEPVTIVAQED